MPGMAAICAWTALSSVMHQLLIIMVEVEQQEQFQVSLFSYTSTVGVDVL